MRDWTLEEARAALPDVRARVERLRRAVTAAPRTNGQSSNGRGSNGTVTEILRELDELGIVVRDPARGLIDFPARTGDGRPYLLCWLAGEPQLEWWHWPEDGFPGRHPLSDPPE
jgi:hypothetical protein